MKSISYDNLQGKGGYVSPLMSVADMGIREVLCSSTSGTDYIEDMKTGDKFDNWI